MGFAERLKKMLNMGDEGGNKIMITGALGYIGSHTAVELIEAGYEVCLVDNLSCTNIDVLEGIEKITDVRPVYENIDCKDYVAMDKFMSKNLGIKTVIHCAALKNEEASDGNPLAYYRNNIGSLVTLLELLPIHKINNLICSVPIAEREDSVYQATIRMGERIINDALKVNNDLRCTVIRHPMAIGAHATSLLGFGGESGELQIEVARVAAGKKEQVSIVKDRVREYVDIMDIARRHKSLIEGCEEGKERMEIIELESGCRLSDIGFVKLFEKVNKLKVTVDTPDEGAEEDENGDTLQDAMRNIWRWQLHLEDLESDGKQRSGHLLGGS